ncbi:MAG: dTMP kinase [Defluviitaleaceae bacterium]|nr:dTMP kinase [Defluviitaleaceae bacterium]
MKFIVIEGIDGSGKSTQVRLLAQRLEKMGLPHMITRQPSDNAVGKVMRAATDAKLPLENETMALLVAADRYQHVHHEIIPALNAGKTVICDRYYYSSFAFQGIDADAFARVEAYNALVMAHNKPDITFFLDTMPEECIRRIHAHRTDSDYSGLYDSVVQLTAIRERYMAIFDQLQNEERFVFLNGNEDEAIIAEKIVATLHLEK